MTKLFSAKTIFIMCLSVFFTMATFSSHAVSADVVQVVPVQATIIDETVIVGEAVTSEGETRNVSAFPADPESYLPMPIPQTPENVGEVVVAPDENKLVVYDLETGEETIAGTAADMNDALGLLETTSSSLGIPGGSQVEDEIEPVNFTNLMRVANPRPYHQRVNGKLFFSKAGGGNFVCSATLIQRNYAITAGHCVHNGKGGTWHRNVVFVPAYDNGAQPYGNARGIRLASFTGWTRSSSFNHDIGIIKLSRNIGSVVGWHGILWRSSRSFYTSTTFNNYSYPAQSPFNGKWMYWRHGTFDGWYNLVYQLRFNNASWGGQSGSSFYRFSGGQRHVAAIVSNSNRTNRTGAPIITQSKFNNIVNWFSTLETGFDLTPLFVEVDNQGKLTYLVNNNSSETWSGTVTANVYLSDNANISAADTQIQTHEFDASFGPLSSVEVHVPSITIPEGTAAGKHYVGVVLDFADANPDNNDSDGQDAGQITVGP